MLFLYALGELRLETAAGEVLSRRRKPLVLLAYLARRAPRAATRAELAALLWGERPEAKARQSLRQALLELHRLAGDAVVATGETVALVPGCVSLDANRFEEETDAGDDAAAVSRWSGPFCGSREDAGEMSFRAWADGENAGLERRLRLAFERQLDAAARRGDDHDALSIARRWTTLVPLDEHACLQHISALRRLGRSADALAVHAGFIARLREELDVAPSRTFARLAPALDESARTPPARPASRPTARPSVDHRQHRLVGRSAAFGTLSEAWSEARRGTPAVVVLRSDHGSGATRLCHDFLKVTAGQRPVVLATDGEPPARTSTRFAGASALFRALGEAPGLGGLSPAALTALSVVVPTLTARFPALPPGGDPSPPDVGAALRDALDALAEDGPVVIVADRFDDLDAESRTLLLETARRLSGGVLVLLVVGTSDGDLRSVELALRGTPSVTSVLLLPLSAAEVGTLLTTSTALAAEEVSSLAGMLAGETGGIPAYVVAMLDAMLDDEVLPLTGARRSALPGPNPGALEVPDAIHAIVHDRRTAQAVDARLVLDAAAVYGQPIGVEAASRLAGLSALDAAAAIEQLAHARLLVPSAHGRFLLAPPIVKRAVFERMPALRREALQAAAQAHAGSAGPLRLVTRRRIVAAAALVVAAATAAVLWTPAETPEPAAAVAVFPFAVSGDSTLRFLETGAVDLLSTSLDGVAGLRTIDPRAVLATVAVPRASPIGVDEARRKAARLGARYFVLGTALGAGGRLEMSASLYETTGNGGPLSRASAAGTGDGLFDIVDRVTAQIAVAHGSPSGARLARLAAITTPSLEALKAYLEGQSAYRANDLFAAIPAYQRAVAADSTFALAWYGLASAASWMLRPGLEQHASAQAVRFGGALSSRDRMLLAGFAAYSRGAADSAERTATTIAEQYDDIEAWVLLGEVLYHHNWKRGRSAVESRRAWERVLALDPRYWPALEHLAEVAALEGKGREADSLLARYERSVGAEHVMLASRAFRAYAYGDAAARAAVDVRLASDRGFWLILSVWYVAVFGRDVEDAQRLARMLVDPLRPPEQQGFGRVLLAHLALARGRWREARAQLAIARVHAPAEAVQQQLLLSLSPFLATQAAVIEEQRAELDRLTLRRAGEPAPTIPWPRPPESLQPMILAYLGGMASARTGDAPAIAASLARLAMTSDPTGESALRDGFASSIRAERARMLGHSDSALVELERAARATPFVAGWTSGIVSQAYERFTRAELLHALHRDDEALRWYGTFAENSPYDLVYLGPALLRQAQIHESRGERRLAVERYTRFVELWADCDEELRPLTALARARITALR